MKRLSAALLLAIAALAGYYIGKCGLEIGRHFAESAHPGEIVV